MLHNARTMATLDVIPKAPAVMASVYLGRHLPSTLKFEIFDRGVQANKRKKKIAVYPATLIAIRPNVIQDFVRRCSIVKKRAAWTRIATFAARTVGTYIRERMLERKRTRWIDLSESFETEVPSPSVAKSKDMAKKATNPASAMMIATSVG